MSPYEFFKVFSEFSGKSKSTAVSVDLNELNEFFVGVGETPAANFQTENLFKFPRNESCFLFFPTNVHEIYKFLKTMKSKQSVGHDGLSTKYLKLFAPVICEPISKLFNSCIQNGVFPDSLKVAKIFPLFKSGDKRDPSNYRPISILPAIAKLFEKLIYKRMLKFITKHCIFSKSQIGFRNKRSCLQAIFFSVVEDIRTCFDERSTGAACLVDLKKAFDTIDHAIFLQKLDRYVFRGEINGLLQSYLTNQKQFVISSGVSSSQLNIRHGVPQGSVLGPLLFLL